MKFFVCVFVLIAVCFAEEEKKTEKRGVLGLGYPYGGVPVASTYHGYGLPYSSPLGYTHGLGYSHGLGLPYAAPAIHAAPAFIPKVAAPLAYSAPLGYAAPYHAPIISKTIAPVSHFGYSSPYLGLGHGVSLLH